MYLSSGAVGTAGRWYQTDASVSAKSTEAITLGMAPADILTGTQGQIRLLGNVNLIGPLVPGAPCHLDIIPGGITTATPANLRFMGQADSAITIIVAPNQGGIIAGTGGGGTLTTCSSGLQLMANAVSRIPLSGSTQGKGIKIAAIATPGTMLHTTGNSVAILDTVWLYMTNSDTTAKKITIEWGAAAVPDDNIELMIPAEAGSPSVFPACCSPAPAAGNIVRAFCATTNLVVAFGYVDRITP